MAMLNTLIGGSVWPSIKARPRLTTPAISPFKPAINMASPADTLRVRLLSMAQHRHARTIKAKPGEAPPCPPGVHASIKPPATMQNIPAVTRRSKFSWNRNQARSAVKAPSRFSRSDAVDAALVTNPYVRATGPTTPPRTMAPESQIQSPPRGRLNEDSRNVDQRRAARSSDSPRPDPA